MNPLEDREEPSPVKKMANIWRIDSGGKEGFLGKDADDMRRKIRASRIYSNIFSSQKGF